MNKKIISLLSLGSVIVIILIVNISMLVTPPRHSSRHVKEQFRFEQLWMKDDISIGGNRFLRPIGFIKIENEYLLSLTVQIQLFSQDWVLKKQNLQTGEDIWEIDFGPTVIKGVVNNQKSIFTISSSQRSCGNKWEPDCEAIRVSSFDLNNGNEQWSQLYDGMLNIDWVEISENEMELHGSGNRGNYRTTFRIDLDNGQLIWSGDPLLSLQEIRGFAKQETEFLKPPEIASPIVSNLAHCKNTTYFITELGVLWAVDQTSRSIVGKIEFSPKESNINIFEARVLCQNSMVFTYFEDSRQIFAFVQ